MEREEKLHSLRCLNWQIIQIVEDSNHQDSWFLVWSPVHSIRGNELDVVHFQN